MELLDGADADNASNIISENMYAQCDLDGNH